MSCARRKAAVVWGGGGDPKKKGAGKQEDNLDKNKNGLEREEIRGGSSKKRTSKTGEKDRETWRKGKKIGIRQVHISKMEYWGVLMGNTKICTDDREQGGRAEGGRAIRLDTAACPEIRGKYGRRKIIGGCQIETKIKGSQSGSGGGKNTKAGEGGKTLPATDHGLGMGTSSSFSKKKGGAD